MTTKTLTIIDALRDPELFQPFLGENQSTWDAWMVCLRAIYGLPIKSRADCALLEQCTGREARSLPREGFRTTLILCGRRSGKSRIASTIAAFEACLSGRESRLSKGEHGVVPAIAPTRRQSRVIRDYCGAIFDTPLWRDRS